MRRHALGILALALLATAAYLAIRGPQEGLSYQVEINSIRVGALLAVFWIAYWDLTRIPPWLWVIFVPVVAILIVRPRWFFFLIPIVLLLAVLHPRITARGRNRRMR